MSKLRFRKIAVLKGLDMEVSRGEIELFGEERAKAMYRRRSRINGIIETLAVTLYEAMRICAISVTV